MVGIQRQDTEGGKSVRFNVSPTEDCPVSNSPIMPPNILISQSTQSTDSTDSTNLSGVLTSHKRSNTVQPRRTQQTGIKICLRIILNIVYLHINRFCSISYNLTNLYSLGFDELRNVVRFLSFQADDNEDLESNENERNEVPDVVSSSAQGRKKFSGRLRLQR